MGLFSGGSDSSLALRVENLERQVAELSGQVERYRREIAGMSGGQGGAEPMPTASEQGAFVVVSSAGAVQPAPFSDEVLRMVAAGRRVQAIKQYREETGCGLLEAKQTIDRIPGP